MQNIVLIGLPGSGKSTIGKSLAKLLNYHFVDTDKIIEYTYKLSITNIILKYGLKRFRQIEQNILKQIIYKYPTGTIIALGGGTFCNFYNSKLCLKKSLVIWLNTDYKIITQISKAG